MVKVTEYELLATGLPLPSFRMPWKLINCGTAAYTIEQSNRIPAPKRIVIRFIKTSLW